MNETKVDLKKLAVDVAAALAVHDPISGWKAEPDERPFPFISRPDGASFTLHGETWAPKGRVLFSPSWPRGEGGEFYKPYNTKFDITVAETRPAAEMAAEVARRLLPSYLSAYIEALGRKDVDDAMRKLRRERADAVAAQFRTTARHERDASTVRVYESVDFEAVTCDGEKWRVKMDLRNPAMEVLVRLLLADAILDAEKGVTP